MHFRDNQDSFFRNEIELLQSQKEVPFLWLLLNSPGIRTKYENYLFPEA